MRRFLFGLFPLLVVLVWAPSSFADVVSPPPETCPEGSIPDSDHGGPLCAPSTCTSDANCTGGLVCREQALCVKQEKYSDQSGERTHTVVTGLCDAAKSCAAPATCDTQKRCVHETKAPKEPTEIKPPTQAPAKGKGCQVSAESDYSLLGLLALVLVVFWRQKQRKG